MTRSTLRQSKPRVSRMVLRRMPQHATAIVSRAVKRTTVGWSRKTFYSLHCSRNSRNIELLSSFVHSLRPRLLFSQTNYVRPSKTQCLVTPTNSIFFFSMYRLGARCRDQTVGKEHCAVEQISYASRYTRSRKQRSFCATSEVH